MANKESSNPDNSVHYPAFFRKVMETGHMGIPPNLNTDLPDRSLMRTMFLDFPYASQSDAQKMDVYLPEAGKAPYPVAVSIHGGGWMLMDKRIGIKEFAEVMLKKGYAVASINHRPTNEAIWPAQIYDCKGAIRCLRANAKKFNIAPNRIVSFGGSSGGHLSAMLGTSGGTKELEDLSMGYADQSSRVNAAVVMSAPINFLRLDADTAQLGQKSPFVHDSDTGPESGLIGGRISKYPERCKWADPTTYIKADNPPFYIQYTPHIPYLQGIYLANALKAAIGEEKVVLDIIETEKGNFGGGPENIDKIFEFLERWIP